MLIVLGACAILLVCSPETVRRTPGLLSSLRPQFSMPHADRRLYPIVQPVPLWQPGLWGAFIKLLVLR